jgi:transcription-repair coupling factor (superfamily II helicase)
LAIIRSEETTGQVFTVVSETPAVQDLQRHVERGGALSLDSVCTAAQPFFAVLLQKTFPGRPIVMVTSGLKVQELSHQDIQTWTDFEPGDGSDAQHSVGKARTLFYPAWEILPHEGKLPHVDAISDRLQTLVTLAQRKESPDPIVVTSVTALLQKTFPAGEIDQRTRVYQRGDRIEPLTLVEWLEEQGYEPEAQVTHKGEVSLRGGILDLWPMTSSWPVRLEFFGDELESLREFDPMTQMSRDEVTTVTIPPGGELGLLKTMIGARSSASSISSETGVADERRERGPVALATLLDYLPPRSIFVLCEPELLNANADRYAEQVPPNDPFFVTWEDFQQEIETRGMSSIELSELTDAENFGRETLLDELNGSGTASLSDRLIEDAPRAAVTQLKFQSLEIFRPIGDRAPEPQIAEAQRKEFFQQLHRWLRQAYTVQVFCNNDGERQRFEEIWLDYGFTKEKPTVRLGAITRGFLFDPAKLVVVTDAEIFGRYKVQRPRRLKSAHAQTSKSLLDIDFTELESGDFVVHLQHGIGRYVGLQVMPIGEGRKSADGSLRTSSTNAPQQGQECLVLEYASSDPTQPNPRLYVPVSEAHLVSKYVGAGKARPPLNAIGGTRWAKLKQQAEHAVRDLAAEMLRIQAARESQVGHSFPADNTWQREFESSFVYEETPDQMRAIIETKKDLESQRPMDRLICGDVGYGKTEVAIRAGFKAVMGGKQVAILVPTTVLAQQHFNTFRERMSDYPIRVELLSRFRSRREQNKTLENLAKGAVDIVIGTHRLLQSDIQFKDLGLVIVDEEQRFGVMHKEKFKRLRTLVDVLTLSATPIPRTLYLALTGARDMSTIETPPQDRLPVETMVTQFDERIIRDAIRREMNRQGQVFFLHNRVTTIEVMAQRIKALVPDARLLIGHGQMDPDELEKVMTTFVNGEADVLLSTTIIESGLDIPNANTIIIDRADRFGLSELYQLRGRVGRYKHQAYAYLLLPRHAGLLVDARKRISAIKQYSSLGSGFKIAMRDLELRGAGNLLGPEQSGHITAVGFDLYCQLLKQSVSSLKGQKVKPRVEVDVRLDFIDTDVPSPGRAIRTEAPGPRSKSALSGPTVPDIRSAHIPLDYVSESQHRIEIYRKLAQTTDKAALEKLKKELRDRFGPVPAPTELLLQIAEMKYMAQERGITSIETKEDKLILMRGSDPIQVGGKFPRLSKKTSDARLREIKKLLLAIV